MSNNKVKLYGEIISDFFINHIHDENIFLSFDLKVYKENDKFDIIKVISNKNHIDNNLILKNTFVYIEGEFHSFNNNSNNKNHLSLFCFVKNISIKKLFDETNYIFINGYICKQPTYRNINRFIKICDLLIAVNRKYNKSDYLPCVLNNKLIETMKDKKIGDNVIFEGRVQSRKYIKKIKDDVLENRIAYEIIIENFISN